MRSTTNSRLLRGVILNPNLSYELLEIIARQPQLYKRTLYALLQHAFAPTDIWVVSRNPGVKMRIPV